MGSIAEFNLYAKRGREAAAKYCTEWLQDVTGRSTELSEQFRLNKLDKATYNRKRSALNKETVELNSCVQMVNK